jgi:hypothetical protein
VNGLVRRVDRLEFPAGANALDGIAERVEAARKRWRDNPDAARRDSAARSRALLARHDADVTAGRWIDPLAARIAAAYRRTGAAA